MWTALQFDNAVMTFGRHIEGKMTERNEDGSAKWKLRDLLDLPYTPAEQREMLRIAMQAFKQQAFDPRSGVKYTH